MSILHVGDLLKYDELALEAVSLADAKREVTGGYTGDLLSWVMGRAKASDAWITIMTNINTPAVAMLADVSCIILAEGVVLDGDALEKAKLQEINVLSTSKAAFEVSYHLYHLLASRSCHEK